MNERRLATVLRVRELQERVARGSVAQRRNELSSRRIAESDAWEAVTDRSRTAPRDAHAFLAHRTMLHAGVTDATSAGQLVARAAADVASALDGWRVEARRLDGTERLAERIATVIRSERARAEANEIDDLVVLRHGRGPLLTAEPHP